MKLKPGQIAPNFTLPDQNGTEHTLSDYRGKWVLVYFYPKDNTPGCTKEACGMRDNHPAFKKLKAVVFGISADSVARHRKFADKYELPFTLLSDEERKVIKNYGAWGKKKFMGKEFMGIIRSSVLIDPEGSVAKVYPKVKAVEHADEVLEDLKKL